MKDRLGHGSDPRGAHAAGINEVGRVPMQPGMWYHGSAAGDPGEGPVHVGTATAAKEALEARIGIPADGRGWDGSREYGKTLLAGKDTLAKLAAAGYHKGFPETGYNAGSRSESLPQHDYYPSQRGERAKFGSGAPVPDTVRPAVHAYNIVGPMTNNTSYPTTDARANGMAKRLKNRGTYYKNIGEDDGSVSAVVPSKTHLRRAG